MSCWHSDTIKEEWLYIPKQLCWEMILLWPFIWPLLVFSLLVCLLVFVIVVPFCNCKLSHFAYIRYFSDTFAACSLPLMRTSSNLYCSLVCVCVCITYSFHFTTVLKRQNKAKNKLRHPNNGKIAKWQQKELWMIIWSFSSWIQLFT